MKACAVDRCACLAIKGLDVCAVHRSHPQADPTRDTLPECEDCGNTGECSECDGNGEDECLHCGRADDCEYCEGSGICQKCHGGSKRKSAA